MGAYGYGPGCCLPLNCGLVATLTNTVIHKLSGDLTLTGPQSGFSKWTASGAGVTVAEGDVGTKQLGNPDVPPFLHFYGELQPLAQCLPTTFTVDRPEIWASIRSGDGTRTCFFKGLAETATMPYHSSDGRCCFYTTPILTRADIIRSTSLILHVDTGLVILVVSCPQEGVAGSGDCNFIGADGFSRRFYYGYFGYDGGEVYLTNAYNGSEFSCGLAMPLEDRWGFPMIPGTNRRYNGIPSTQREDGNYPDSLTVASTAVPPGRVWVGMRNSVGIAYEHGTRTWSAVTLGSDGNITGTIADARMGTATRTPRGGFWWTDEETVQFAWFDEVRDNSDFASSGAYIEVKEYIRTDYASPEPQPSVRTGYIGADGPFDGWSCRLGCWGKDCAQVNQVIPDYHRRRPSRLYLPFDCGAFETTQILYSQVQIYPNPCSWGGVNASYNFYVTFVVDLGQTTPDIVTLAIHGLGGTTAYYEGSLGSFDSYRNFTVTLVDDGTPDPRVTMPPTLTWGPYF